MRNHDAVLELIQTRTTLMPHESVRSRLFKAMLASQKTATYGHARWKSEPRSGLLELERYTEDKPSHLGVLSSVRGTKHWDSNSFEE